MSKEKQTYNPCDDCQYSYSKNGQESRMCKICELEYFKDRVLDYREQTKWISVEERLPETSDKVLVYDAGGNISTAVFVRVKGFEDWISVVNYAEKVTHWMPLPEAPKGGAE